MCSARCPLALVLILLPAVGCVRAGFEAASTTDRVRPYDLPSREEPLVDARGEGWPADLRPRDAPREAATPGPHLWSRQIGGAGTKWGEAAAVDASGNLYLAGSYLGSMSIGGSTFLDQGGGDIFLASYDGAGTFRWAKSFGGPGADMGLAIGVDSSGNVHLGGVVSSALSFGGGVLASGGGLDGFVASFDSSGAHRWSKRFGVAGNDWVQGLAVDPASGNLYVTGRFFGSVDFGTGPLVQSMNASAIVVASYGADGTPRWAKKLSGTNSALGTSVAVKGDQPRVVGTFYGSIDLGGGSFGGGGLSANGFLLGQDASGGNSFAVHLQGIGDFAPTVAADLSGNAMVAAHTLGVVDLGAGPVNGSGTTAAAIAWRAAASGSGWGKVIATNLGSGKVALGRWSGPSALPITFDLLGNLAVAGSFAGTTGCGGPQLTSAGGQDIFVCMFDPGGPPRWSAALGGSGTEAAHALASDAKGNLYLVGAFNGTIDPGGGTMTAEGASDLVVVKLKPGT